MVVAHSVRPSARQRLLDVANDAFYQEGIRAIGVDTIVERSGVGKATLYRHFSTKNDLIVAYLEEKDRRFWRWFEEMIAPYEGKPVEQLLAVFDSLAQHVIEPEFRGCPFLNALAEIADINHPAHRRALAHEREIQKRLSDLSQQAGAHDPEQLANQLLLIINGMMVSTSILDITSPTFQYTALAAHLINLQLGLA